MSSQPATELSPLYLITDRTLARPDLFGALEAALKGGVRMIQLREKDLAPAELRRFAEKALKLTRFYGAKLLLNDAPELAEQIGADGVQLGVNSCQISTARRILGDQAIIGYSAHSTHEVESATHQGANFVTFSPVYYTASKAQYGPPQGLKALGDICEKSVIPVYALGGINSERIGDVLNAGAHGIALISALFGANNVQKKTQQILLKMRAP